LRSRLDRRIEISRDQKSKDSAIRALTRAGDFIGTETRDTRHIDCRGNALPAFFFSSLPLIVGRGLRGSLAEDAKRLAKRFRFDLRCTPRVAPQRVAALLLSPRSIGAAPEVTALLKESLRGSRDLDFGL